MPDVNDNHCDACLKLSNHLDALEDEKQKLVAMLIKNSICPFGVQPPGKALATCPSGFPGCGCADELMLNPYLGIEQEEGVETPALCSECGVNPEPSYGGWCPDCACGAESGCPAKYGHEDEPCPHDWCPHGGRSPR